MSPWVPVAITLGIFFCGQLGTAMWWGSRMNANVRQLTLEISRTRKELHELVLKVEALATESARTNPVNEVRIEHMAQSIVRLEKRIERLEQSEVAANG